MTQLADFITEDNAIIFFLLFSRISGVMAFFPFYSHTSISVMVKSALIFYLSILFFPAVTLSAVPVNISDLILMVLSEFMLGFIAGLVLNMIFGALGLAGMQIAMVMGFSMASVMDPTTGTNTPIISNILTLLAIMMLLAFDGHHLMLLFLNETMGSIELGGFYPEPFIWKYLSSAFTHLFVMGFIIAFPIMALSILSDVIFGMLMKTMPQFNLLVVGFPIKIFLSIMVLAAVLGAMMNIFKREFLEAFEFLKLML
ncbi:MAG TPA: flagellar type III secretion system protein FliR [Campylobacterales bacterium]|nr:flagellar type III secretion system protein FliR [Campylobacterales bacterium]HIP60089.1 flagellar type III secretion system protein FliR [Campylobacterales bacterium]